MKILYTSYIGFGNLGDDLCLEAFEREAAKRGVVVIPSTPAEPGKDQLAYMEKEIAQADKVVIGGGSLFTYSYYLTFVLKASLLGKPVYFWGTGLDEFGLKTAIALSTHERLDQVELGSMNVELLKSAISKAKKVFVRGPITKNALSIIHPTLSGVRVVGDPGFLVKPDETAEAEIFKSGQPVIAINWGSIGNEAAGFGGNNQEAAEQFFRALEKLSGSYSFLFFPMNTTDSFIHKKWADSLKHKTNIELINEVPNANVLAGWIRQCRMMIGRKLHAQVLAAASITPFISLAYRSKCFDFAASVDLSNMVVQTGSEMLTEDVLALTQTIETKRDEIVEKLNTYRAVYRLRLIDAVEEITKPEPSD